MKNFYFELGQLYFLKAVPNEGLIQGLQLSDNSLELAFFHIYTAASLGHKQARAYLAIYFENGIFPNRDIIKSYIQEGERYEYL